MYLCTQGISPNELKSGHFVCHIEEALLVLSWVEQVTLPLAAPWLATKQQVGSYRSLDLYSV